MPRPRSEERRVLSTHGSRKTLPTCKRMKFDPSFIPVTNIKGKTTACNTGIPYGHWFESLLFHFQSSSLLMHLGKQQRLAQVPGPLPTMSETRIEFLLSGFGLA